LLYPLKYAKMTVTGISCRVYEWKGLHPIRGTRDIGLRANLAGNGQGTDGVTGLANERAVSGGPPTVKCLYPKGKDT
jgi:hypothetical protein